MEIFSLSLVLTTIFFSASDSELRILNSQPFPSFRKKDMWEGLPDHLLARIADKLICITDYVRFSAVCVSWRSVFIKYQRRHLPVLMIPTKHNDNQQTRSFYSLAQRRVYDFQLPVPHNKSCRGSSQGWLLTVDENFEVQLLNPFSTLNNEIQLPPLTDFSDLHDDDEDDITIDSYFCKAVLSANPTLTSNYVVMVIYGACFGRLDFFKPGDKVWTSIDSGWRMFDDVIYYKDQFYAVDHEGAVVACDVRPLHPVVTNVAPPPPAEYLGNRVYLVELSGDLLQVVRIVHREYIGDDLETWSTVGFQIFKLDRIGSKWVEVKSLCDRMIFLGDNSSVSLSAFDFPGCKPNCIYFTDDNIESYSNNPPYWPHDMGVFNLQDGSFELHYCPESSEMVMPPPIWVEPMLQGCCI